MQNLTLLKTFKTPNDFIKGFSLTEEHWKQFILAAARDSINIAQSTGKEKSDLTNHIKSSIARQLWRSEGYFEVMNTADEGIKKALEILEK